MSRAAPAGFADGFPQDESIMTTLRVIMDVLKSHDGSIKKLQKWLDNQDSTTKDNGTLEYSSVIPSQYHSPPLPLYEVPVRDQGPPIDIPDDQSEVSSIVSSRTEYRELPTRSTFSDSTVSPNTANRMPASNHIANTGLMMNGLFSTPMKGSSSPPKADIYPAVKPVMLDRQLATKFDTTLSSIETDPGTLGGKLGMSSKVGLPIAMYQSPLKSTMLDQSTKTANESSPANVSIGVLNTRLNLLEGQVTEWGEIMDEMSDRMANQPTLIRKFAKESTLDKVTHSQYNEDIGSLEKRVLDKVNEKFSSLDRKIVELYDDVSSRVTASPSSKENDKRYARQDTAVQLSIDIETLSEQTDEHKGKLRALEKEMSQLNETVKHMTHDVNLYRHHVTGMRSDDELVSLVAEHILDREDITGWKEALKETHSALNKQSEINTSLHHSYAALDKKMNSFSFALPHYGRWRWGGISSVYPRGHSCVGTSHSDDISFVAQISNTDSRAFAWEKNKPYIVVTTAGCYWVTIGAFGLKSGVPPSLQVTVDEEVVPLFNSSGRSPTHQRLSVTSSAPKQQPQAYRFRGETTQWKPGSSLAGALMLPAHSRLSVCAASTASGTRIGVEGYLDLQRIY